MILLKNFWISFAKISRSIRRKKRGSEFIFDSVDLLHYNLQRTNLKRDGSYVDSPKWLKNKKAATNQNNNDNNCFQYALTVALNYQDIKKDP